MPGLPFEVGSGAFDFAAVLAIADMLPVMVVFLDREERVRFLNKPLAVWLGRPRRELLGRTAREILGEVAYAQRGPLLAAALAGERVYFASAIEHPTRGSLAIESDYMPWKDADGAVRGIVIMVQDVTEQRSAERALRESEQRFRRIANQAPVLMWVTASDGTREFVNDAYAQFVGLAPNEARALDWRKLIHPDDLERVIAESAAGEASLKTVTLEARHRRHDGHYCWIRSSSSPRFGPDGELVGFIGAGTDVSVAKQAELDLKRQVEERTAELARREGQFRAVFEAALEVMVLLDPDGNVLAVNNRREAWRHPEPQQGVGKKLWQGPTLEAYPQHVPLIKQAVATAARGESFTQELRMEREGTPTAYLDVSMQPIREPDGRIVYLLFEARDITELKAAQEQLRQSQKMEALGQLTGGIAHDFNNLLTVVVGGLDLLTKRVEDAKLKRYATNALTAAERGARLTGQLLAFSRVQRLEVRPTPVAPLIDDMRPLLRNVLGPGIEKRFELDEDPVSVLADPTQVEVAVLNLAINARDAMPAGGVLTITTRKTRIAGDPELDAGDYVELAISDTGSGMSRDVRERAFEPFFTTKEVGKGTGLGLSMVYGMARQSGGTARIDSEPGKGTSVSLFFKVAAQSGDAVALPEREDPAADPQQAAESVLVIDDDPDVRAFISEALGEQGYRVREAADGESGLKAFAAERPDLAVIDFIMPGLSGAEVARRMLSERPGQAILFVSGYSETESIRRTAPDALLLTKPFRAEALGKAVRGALAKS